jgi:WD40 repeat protein
MPQNSELHLSCLTNSNLCALPTQVVLWDVNDGAAPVAAIGAHEAPVLAVAGQPGGGGGATMQLASASLDGSVKLWSCGRSS